MVENFSELKRKKERGITNTEFLEMCSRGLKDHEQIVVTSIDKNGVVDTYYTQMDSLSVIGMMEIAKTQMIEETKI